MSCNGSISEYRPNYRDQSPLLTSSLVSANTPQESLILRLETHRTPIALIPTVTPTPLPPAFDPTNPHTFSTPRFAVEDESQPIGLGSHRRNAPGYKGVGIGGGGTGAVRIQAEGNGRERCLMRALIGEKEYVSLQCLVRFTRSFRPFATFLRHADLGTRHYRYRSN